MGILESQQERFIPSATAGSDCAYTNCRLRSAVTRGINESRWNKVLKMEGLEFKRPPCSEFGSYLQWMPPKLICWPPVLNQSQAPPTQKCKISIVLRVCFYGIILVTDICTTTNLWVRFIMMSGTMHCQVTSKCSIWIHKTKFSVATCTLCLGYNRH